MAQGVQSCFGIGIFFQWMYMEPYFPKYHRNKREILPVRKPSLPGYYSVCPVAFFNGQLP